MTDPQRRTISADSRAVFDRALAKSVDALFDQPAETAAALLDEFLRGKLILVLTKDALWARPVEDASGPQPEYVAPWTTKPNTPESGTGNYI